MISFKYFGLCNSVLLLFIFTEKCFTADTCQVKLLNDKLKSCLNSKFIIYNVNQVEGFNLRRDVYMRLAIWIRKMMNKGFDWHLILPPWNHLYHWRSKDIGSQDFIPWGLFFDISSLRQYAPIMEMYDYFDEVKDTPLDYVIILQHYKDLFSKNNNWENDKWSFEDCLRPHNYIKINNELFMGPFLGYSNITAKNVKCVSFYGQASMLEEIVNYVNGSETVLHDHFGNREYWNCRKSMKFSFPLTNEANTFMENVLNVSYSQDAHNKNKTSYACVHLRRNDFVKSHPEEVPNIKWAAYQLDIILKKINVTSLFVATDAPKEEFEELKSLLSKYSVKKYTPSLKIRETYKDGGVAIIEQIICSHARFFVGTHHSTFSFRIQEEREILGFNPTTTFNRLCGNNILECTQPSKWLMVD